MQICHFRHSTHLISIPSLQYSFFVITKDKEGELVDKPLKINIVVEDINDNPPVCQNAVTILEVQENESGGKKISFIHSYSHNSGPLIFSGWLQTETEIWTPKCKTFFCANSPLVSMLTVHTEKRSINCLKSDSKTAFKK